MALFKMVALVALASMSTMALSQPPFVFNGLHVGLPLNEAIAQAEQLGGYCEADRSNRALGDGERIQCTYSACAKRDGAEDCEEADLSAGSKVAAQPIVSVGLEARDGASPVTRIMIVHEGDTDALAASLLAEFGQADAGGAPTGKSSWSHARRWSWTRGVYRMGLLNLPKMLVLTVDAAQEPAVEQPAAATP